MIIERSGMKRRDWVKLLKRNGTHRESVSRQTEIDENLIKDIIARRGLK
jgi:hypothetical protein